MDLVLIPGFWLDGDSWSGVTPALEAAGHTVHPLTLPGKESVDADRSGISLRDHVDAVIAYVDTLQPGVVLVGHSGGGAIAYAVADARPDAIARIVYVDSGPLAEGDCINDNLPAVNGEVPLPDWSVFDDESLRDLDDDLRAHFRAIAIPEPAQVAAGNQQLSSLRRYDVPSTVICCEMSSEVFRDLIAQGHPYVAELAKATNYELVDLPTSHWPQFTKPAELVQVILAAVDKTHR